MAPSERLPRAVSRSTGQERVLCALTPAERETFSFEWPSPFPGLSEIEWFDPRRSQLSDWAAALKRLEPTVIVSCWSTPPLGDFLPLAGLGRLSYVCHLAGSVRAIVPRSFLERGGLVSNWGDAVCAQVAEHALLLALAGLRNAVRWRSYIAGCAHRQANHARELETRTLFGRRVGIHGFGRIARALVELLRPFRVEIYAYSPGVPASLFETHGVARCDSLEQLFGLGEVLFECEALTPFTRGMVDAGTLAALPNGAVFVNVGRGHVVDEAALRAEALSGRIRVALDVVQEEPMTARSEIFFCEEALFSPHIGGPTWDRYPDCGRIAINNLSRYAHGLPLESLVSLADYDRST